MDAKNIIECDRKSSGVRPSLHNLSRGDVETALKSCKSIVEGSIKTARQEHFYEELNNCLVIPIREDDEYKVYVPTPNVLMFQQFVAKTLGIPLNRVEVHTKRVGCSYGGKMIRFMPLTCAVALAAKLTGRPIRLCLTRDEDIRIMGQRG